MAPQRASADFWSDEPPEPAPRRDASAKRRIAAVAGTILVLAGLVGAVLYWHRLPPFGGAADRIAAGEEPASALSALLSSPASRPGRLATPLRLEAPYAAISSTSLQAGGQTITLAHVAGLSRDAVCLHANGRKFPCGLMGRASLQNRLKENPVLCQPAFYFADDIRYRCFLGRHDVAGIQVRTGWARRDGVLDGGYRDEQAAARSESRGAWSGDWALAGTARPPTRLPVGDLRRSD